MAKPVTDQATEGTLALADLLVNKALACDRAGQQDKCTAHLEVALKVMFPRWSSGPVQDPDRNPYLKESA